MVLRSNLSCQGVGRTGHHSEGTEYTVPDIITLRHVSYQAGKGVSVLLLVTGPDRFQVFSMPTGGKLKIIEAESKNNTAATI